MVNTRFIEGEIERAEKDYEKLKSSIFDLRSEHSRKKEDVERAKRDDSNRATNLYRLEELKKERDAELERLEQKLRQMKTEQERAKRTLADEMNVKEAARERLERANLAFDTIDRKLEESVRKEREFKSKVTELHKQLESLGEKLKHSA